MQESPGKVSKNTQLRGNTSKVDSEAVLQTCILSIFPRRKSATPRNRPKERQLAFALLQREAQSRIDTFFPSRSSIVRMAHNGAADGSAVSDAGPVETAADQETDPAVKSGVGVKLSCRGQ